MLRNMETIYTINSRLYEYSDAVNPKLPDYPQAIFSSNLYEREHSNITPLDMSNYLKYKYPATTPNLLANFIQINVNSEIKTKINNSTSHMFYVIKGNGCSIIKYNMINWKKGDIFVIPYIDSCKSITHIADKDSVLFWVNDSPLMNYLGVLPNKQKFNITHFKSEKLYKTVEDISKNPENKHKNRCGVLLGVQETENTTKTLTHTLWTLLNKLPSKSMQKPHRHNSVAIDLCINMKLDSKDVYTLMGPELNDDGVTIKKPKKIIWSEGDVFITPPGWWHSHHNDSDEEAWVLPIQDAGLLTNQQILDIKFTY